MSRKKKWLIAEVVMIISLCSLFFGMYFIQAPDWLIRILGTAVMFTLIAMVYNGIQIKKERK